MKFQVVTLLQILPADLQKQNPLMVEVIQSHHCWTAKLCQCMNSILSITTYIGSIYRIPVLDHAIHTSKSNSWFNTYDFILRWFPRIIFNWPILSQVLIWSNFSYKISIWGPICIFIMARIKSSVFSTYISSTPLIHRFEKVTIYQCKYHLCIWTLLRTSQYFLFPGWPRIDGKEFFRQARFVSILATFCRNY